MIIMRLILTLLLFTLVSCRGGQRGDQGPPEEEDFTIEFGTKVDDILDENIQDMTPENTQIVASVLVVAGIVVVVVLVIVAVILVIRSMKHEGRYEVRSKADKDEDSEAISRLGRKLEVQDKKKEQEKERLTLIDQIRFSLVKNLPE